MSSDLFERAVLSKVYFDRQGLIVAAEGDHVVGFVHAGFGPNSRFDSLSYERGVTSMLMVSPRPDAAAVAADLLAASEQYLCDRGSTTLLAGGHYPLSPFYWGLSGGSDLPGILAAERSNLAVFQAAGYEETDQRIILHCSLSGFRPVIDRQQMQIRRSHRIEAVADPVPANWWEACTFSHSDHTRFSLVAQGGEPRGTAMFWDMEPLAGNWGVHAAGLFDVRINEGARRQGHATFLIAESMRQLQTRGITLVEAQISRGDLAAAALFAKLGFKQIETGLILSKSV